MIEVDESSKIVIPVRNLIGMVVIASMATYAYFGIEQRLDTLEYASGQEEIKIEQNSNWIRNWERQGELPVDKMQNHRLELLEKEVERLKVK